MRLWVPEKLYNALPWLCILVATTILPCSSPWIPGWAHCGHIILLYGYGITILVIRATYYTCYTNLPPKINRKGYCLHVR